MTDFKRDGSHLSYCPPVEKWTIGLSSMLEPGRAASRSIISLFQPSASTANRVAGFSLTSIRRPEKSRSLKATRCILPAVGGFVRRDRQRLRRFTIRIGFFIR